jgi:tetratricopeptide (TPR) repeat protein
MKTEALKEEARRHEQREEWGKALALYLQAIDRQATEDEPEIALHNRVGDLQLRLGDVAAAVTSYDKAITLYLDAGLPNNAIAVCRKIIRNDPRRPDPFLRMGRIRASQGLYADARQNFFTYAEMLQAKGKSEEAAAALEELAAAAPDDAETREALAERLVQRDRMDEALVRFDEAHAIHVRAGDAANAARVLDRVRALAPSRPQAEIPKPVEAARDRGVADSSVEDARGLGGFERTSLGDEPDADEVVLDAAPVVGYDPGQIGADDEGEVVAGPAALTEDDTADAEADTWHARARDSHSAHRDDHASRSDDEGAEGSVALPYLTADEEEFSLGGEEGEDASPTGPEGSELELPDLVPTLRERVASDPADGEGWLLLARELLERGDEGEGAEALQHAHEAYAAGGDAATAVQVAEELLRLQPARLDVRQRVVEYAHMTGDDDLLVGSFLELASALRDAGDGEHAHAVLERVLEIDPENARARDLLAVTPPRRVFHTPPPARKTPPPTPEPESPPARVAAEPPPPAPAPPETREVETPERVPERPAAAAAPPIQGDYVDLGALVLDERGEETTRWVVSAEAPTADEDADFRRTLQLFKAKVAENLGTDDAQGHYDLGTAYMEMGLVDEAIGEFQQSLRADPGNLAAFEMLGQCFLDKGEPKVAIRTLERGLRLPIQVEDDLLGIYYALGNSHEAVGNTDSAKEFYERIFALDINFKDVTDRLRDLR